MTSLWDDHRSGLDLGYQNIRDAKSPVEQRMREDLDSMWLQYEPYADQDFRSSFAHAPDDRFWEMYVACQLLNAGKKLLPNAERLKTGGQPDICVLHGEGRIWIEAIAPTRGNGPDKVVGPTPIDFDPAIKQDRRALAPAPRREMFLRITGALWEKSKTVRKYRTEGPIQPDDVALIAIGVGSFGIYASETPVPMILQSVFPIGDEYVTLDTKTNEIVHQGFHFSPVIKRASGDIPRDAFLDPEYSHVSGVIWSRVSTGNMSREVRPLSLVHNPEATVGMPQNWGVWDREFVATEQAPNQWSVEDILAES